MFTLEMMKLQYIQGLIKYGFIALLLCFVHIGFAQPKSSVQKKSESKSKVDVDDAKTVAGAPTPESKDDVYLDSAKQLYNTQPSKAIDYINKAIEPSTSSPNERKENEASAFLILGNIQQNQQQHVLAIENYTKCIQSILSSKQKFKSAQNLNQTTLFNAYKQMAISLTALNKEEDALLTITKCFNADFYAISKIDKLEAKRVLARIKLKQRELKECHSILDEVLEQERALRNKKGEIETEILIGELYQQEGNEAQAINHYTKAKSLSEESNNTSLTIKTNDLLAKIFRKQKNVEQEVAARSSNIRLNTASNNEQANAKENIEIGNAYLAANQAEKAEPYYDKGTNVLASQDVAPEVISQKPFSKSDVFNESANGYKRLAEEYTKRKDFAKAAQYFKKYAALQDSIQYAREKELEEAISLSSKIGKNQQRIDLLEKERALSQKAIDILKQDQLLKQKELNTRNTIIISLILCLIFMLIGGFYILKSSKEKRRVNQVLALKSLRGQMNPHFIFNALNSVNHYVAQNDERLANRYLSDFSKLMRLVMDSSKHDFIFLADELEMLKLYLQLEHERFKEKFDYDLQISAEVEDASFELPPMLIQPYLENAVWHGLRYINGKGHLTITFDRVENELRVTIVDNGIGRLKSRELKTQNQKKQVSLGMQNIDNRVEIMNEIYRTNIRIEISDAYPEKTDCGTQVLIFIPQKNK